VVRRVSHSVRRARAFFLRLARPPEGEILPTFADLRLIDASSVDRWTDQPSYLNHPSAYYVLMAWAAAPFELPAAELVRPWRLMNVTLAVGALVVVLRLGQEAGWSAPAQAAFVTLIAFNPTLPVLGGIVTNDNLAFLGGALCCLGVFRLLAGQRSGGAWITVALGALLAALAKLTAAVLCSALLACALAWLVAQEGWAVLRRWPVALCLIACCLGLLPYLLLILQYGSPAPFTDGQAAMLASRLAELPDWREQRYGLLAYLGHFAQSLLVYWPPAPPETRLEIALLAAPAACLGIAALGIARAVIAMRRGTGDAMAVFVICGGLALGMVMLIHLGFTYQRHLETGWLRGVYPRYYFPLLPVLSAACAWLVSSCGRGRPAIWLAGALVALAVGYDLTHSLAIS
jgi:hypothetical protein